MLKVICSIAIFLLVACNNITKNKDEGTLPIWKQKLLFVDTLKTCEEAETLANYDFNSKQYKVIKFGLPQDDDFYIIYAKIKYGIEILYAGCLGTEYEKCYSHKMQELLYTKSGISLYKIKKESEEELKRIKQDTLIHSNN